MHGSREWPLRTLLGGIGVAVAIGAVGLLVANRPLESIGGTETASGALGGKLGETVGQLTLPSGKVAQPADGQLADQPIGGPPVSPAVNSTALTIRGVNWSRYPGTLGDQITAALDGNDGSMAMFLAQRASDCVTYVMLPEQLGRNNLSDGLGSSAEDQAMKSLCQTVEGDWQLVANRLFEKAVHSQIPGAAAGMFASSGKLSSAASIQIVLDANSGHLMSVITLAAVPPKALGTSAEDKSVARYALLTASQQVDEKLGRRWIEALQQISSRWEPGSQIELPRLSGDAKARGDAAAGKIVEGARKGP